MVTFLKNIELSNRLKHILLDSGGGSSIVDAIGLNTLDSTFGAPMIGSETLYEAVLAAYIQDRIEIGRICCMDCYSVTLHTQPLHGEAIVNAIDAELAIRLSPEKHYRTLFKAYSEKLLDFEELVESYINIGNDDRVNSDGVEGLVYDVLIEQLNQFPIASIHDTEEFGLERAEQALAFFEEEVENASK